MARETGRLTALQVKALKTRGRHADGDNLYLVVSKSGAKRWSFIYRERGTSITREIGFGSLSTVGLAKAREMSARARLLIFEGKDPKAAKLEAEAQSSAPTFEKMLDELHASLAPGFRNKKHRKEWLSSVKRYAGNLLKKKVNEVTTSDVRDAVTPIWSEKTETASRVRQRIERVLDWAKALGHRGGDNPARWRGNLDIALTHPKELKKVRHHPACGSRREASSELTALVGLPYRSIVRVMGRC